MRFIFTIFTVFLFILSAGPAQARTEGIAAVVNDGAISMSDVNDRMALFIASSGLPNTQDVRRKLIGQVLSSLIEEELKLQEAARLNIEVSDQEIQQGFANIAAQNNMPPEKFRAMLERGGLNFMTMERQIRAQIAWTKIVQSQLRPRINIADKDIDNTIERMGGNVGKQEYLLAEIYLPVDEPKKETATRQLAQKLVREIKGEQAPFFQVAQQFSKSAGASSGGDLGWVQEGQLPEDLDEVLPGLNKNEVSQPIRTPEGFHILYLRDKRSVEAENMPSREKIMSDLGLERLERLARRYLLDLKAEAFIENRLES